VAHLSSNAAFSHLEVDSKVDSNVGCMLCKRSFVSQQQFVHLFSPGGEVVAVGDGRTVGDKKLEISVKSGAKVVYSKFAGTEVEFNGESHLLLKEDDLVGLLSGDDIKELQPLNDRILIQVSEAESKTAGGILLTESAKEKPVIGTVIATGPGTYGEDGERKALDISSGNQVLYSKYAGNEFKNKDGVQYVVLRASDILAILA
jgi:chaperonin GroES